MATDNTKSAKAVQSRKTTVLITSDMVIDLYLKAKTLKGKEKQETMEKVIFLSQHLNRYTPIVVEQYQ
jgi:hypothetical protein